MVVNNVDKSHGRIRNKSPAKQTEDILAVFNHGHSTHFFFRPRCGVTRLQPASILQIHGRAVLQQDLNIAFLGCSLGLFWLETINIQRKKVHRIYIYIINYNIYTPFRDIIVRFRCAATTLMIEGLWWLKDDWRMMVMMMMMMMTMTMTMTMMIIRIIIIVIIIIVIIDCQRPFLNIMLHKTRETNYPPNCRATKCPTSTAAAKQMGQTPWTAWGGDRWVMYVDPVGYALTLFYTYFFSEPWKNMAIFGKELALSQQQSGS